MKIISYLEHFKLTITLSQEHVLKKTRGKKTVQLYTSIEKLSITLSQEHVLKKTQGKKKWFSSTHP